MNTSDRFDGHSLEADGRGPALAQKIEADSGAIWWCAPWLRDIHGHGYFQGWQAAERAHEEVEATLRADLQQAEHERDLYFERMTFPDLDARRAAANQRIDQAFEERNALRPWPTWRESVQLACEAARAHRAEAIAA